MINCEQNHCNKQNLNLDPREFQYYCVKCDMELCAVCIFEHRKGYSISGLTCDNEICYGSRKQNSDQVS
jgi:hypothetical protein